MSRFLIDTNVLVHFLEEVLDEHTYELLRDYANQIYISSVSVMEFINLVQSGRVKNHKFGKEKVLQLITEKLYFKVLYVLHNIWKSWKDSLRCPTTTTPMTV